jgi:integrase
MFYLGRYGSVESRAEYNRIVAEWMAAGPESPPPASPEAEQPDVTVAELILAYWGYVQSYYIKCGKHTSEVDTVRQALRPVRELYGHTPARSFGPLALKACQDAMIGMGWARTYINRQINRVKRMFGWAVANELLPVTVYQALTTVPGLRKSRTNAKEKPPVGPVSDDVIGKTLDHLPPVVAAMVRVQRLTGARPQEVVELRAVDIDMSDPSCWVYRPGRHKGEHHDRERIIFIGPRAIEVLKPFLTLDISAHLFSPKESVARRNARRRSERKTPLWGSHRRHQAQKRKAQPKRPPQDCYTVASYRRAIRRACLKADLPVWHPHQIRHTAGTAIRRQYGLEGAQACLGHAELGVTQVYAAKNLDTAREIMKAIG